MSITASKLRENIYKLLDQVLKTGRPLEIERNGKILKIIADKPASKLSRLERHSVYKGNPEELVHLDWEKEWQTPLK